MIKKSPNPILNLFPFTSTIWNNGLTNLRNKHANGRKIMQNPIHHEIPPQPPLMFFSCFFATFFGKRGSFISYFEFKFTETTLTNGVSSVLSSISQSLPLNFRFDEMNGIVFQMVFLSNLFF